MRKIICIGALTSLLLVACGDEPVEKSEVEETVIDEGENVESPVENVEGEGEEFSSAQLETIEAFKSSDFMDFANSFYALTAPERSAVYRSDVEQQFVTWTGIITDLETIKDSIIIVGDENLYTGADWNTLQKDTPDAIPYTIIFEMSNIADKSGLKNGDIITLKGEIGARGDLDMKYNWKLYKGEIVK